MTKQGLLLVLGSLVLVSCSGEKADQDQGASIVEAQFIDAPVKGLSFLGSSTAAGKTGNAGKFSCVRGEELTFKLKGFDLGKAACGDQIFVHDLSSETNGFTWGKAASIIQTFSKSSNVDQLDLSTVENDSTVVLSGLNYSTTFDSTLDSFVDYSRVSVTDSVIHANNSLDNHVKLSTILQEALDDIVSNGSVYLHATLKSEVPADADWCSKNIKALATIFPINSPTMANPNIYGMSFSKAIGYGTENEITHSSDFYSCAGNAQDCAIVPSKLLPGQKIISSNKIEMLGSATYSEPADVIGNIEVYGRNVFGLNVIPADGDLEVQGSLKTYSRIVNAPTDSMYKAGDNVTCTYDVALFEFAQAIQ